MSNQYWVPPAGWPYGRMGPPTYSAERKLVKAAMAGARSTGRAALGTTGEAGYVEIRYVGESAMVASPAAVRPAVNAPAVAPVAVRQVIALAAPVEVSAPAAELPATRSAVIGAEALVALLTASRITAEVITLLVKRSVRVDLGMDGLPAFGEALGSMLEVHDA